MGLYEIINRMEERRKKLKMIKHDLIETKEHMSKSIIECEDADEMIRAITKISLAIAEIDEMVENIL